MELLLVNNTDFQGTLYNGHDLQISLNEAGIDASEIVLYKRTDCETARSFVTEKELTWQHQYNEIEKRSGLLNLLEPFGGKIKYTEQFQRADIVHFQLLHNHVVTLQEFARICSVKPCVWTIHDLWAVSGHCIHPRECDGWKRDCRDCQYLEDPFFSLRYPKANELWKAKESLYKRINPDIIVASDFTRRYIEQSPLMSHFTNIHKIPFGIKMKEGVKKESDALRKKWNIPLNNIVISFRLSDSKLKGVKYLVRALERMHAKNITVLAVDRGEPSILDPIRSKYQIVEIGQLSSEGMQHFYQVTDIFAMPSLAETFGLMAVEAMAAKCAVVVFEGTVLPEITFAPQCGVSVPFKDDRALAEALDHLAISPDERMARGELGYTLVCRHYRFEDYVSKHIDVYRQMQERLTSRQKRQYTEQYKNIWREKLALGRVVALEEKKKSTMLKELSKISGGQTQKTCIFCAGAFAGKAYEILRKNGVPVDVLADNNPDKWGYWNYGISCISKEQLAREREITLVIVANKRPAQIKAELREVGFKYVIDYYELEKIDQKLMEIYGNSTYDKIAELDYSDTNTMELLDLMNRKICEMSQYYEKQIVELKAKRFEPKPLKAIAMYLPQFHETKENNEWWGEGFTEWTSVKKAKALYEGHYQPHMPENGYYYNLLEKSTMEWQAELARKANVYGFCFYHYWFKDGRRVLEKPAENLLQWKDIDIHFCFSWANESWIRTWSNVKGGNAWVSEDVSVAKTAEDDTGILLEQQYGTEKDWKEHFEYLLPFFKDDRYIKIDGKPVFMIYRPELVDCMDDMLAYWKQQALLNGFPGLFIMCANCEYNSWSEVDARYIQEFNYSYSIDSKPTGAAVSWDKGILTYDYDVLWKNIICREYDVNEEVYLGACVNFDCTPRHGKKGNLTVGGTPEKFAYYFEQLCRRSIRRGNEYVFINAWNEWGEGMHLEPDVKYGMAYLEAVNTALSNANCEYRKVFRESDKHPESGFRQWNSGNNETAGENIGDSSPRAPEISAAEYNSVCRRSQKFVDYFNLFDSWLAAKEENRNIAGLLADHGITKVAVYGGGKVGNHLLAELKNTEVSVSYIIDRKCKTVSERDIPVYDPDSIAKVSEKVDAVIVTAVFDFANIKESLAGKITCPVLSLNEVLEWR